MVKVCDMEFATSIGVLFKIKELNGCKTLQETYKVLETTDIDKMLEILRISYNLQNRTVLDTDDFYALVGQKQVGFLLLADIFQQVTEGLLFDGLTPEQIEAKKKLMKSLEQ